jgi:hypothetical protein
VNSILEAMHHNTYKETMMKARFALLALVFALGLALPALAASPGKAPDGPTAAAALESLKKLAGTWQGKAGDGAQTFDAEVEYRVASGGSVVMETLFGGTEHEMISMYHLDGDALVMTHYCAMGNQPRMRLDGARSSADHLVFEFAGGSNMDPKRDPHVHAGEIWIKPDATLAAKWHFYAAGKLDSTKDFTMARKPD